jgi:hypothetical protein
VWQATHASTPGAEIFRGVCANCQTRHYDHVRCPGQGTRAGNINPREAIAGRYIDASDVSHGFLRAPDGTITTFDAPNAGAARSTSRICLADESSNTSIESDSVVLNAEKTQHGIERIAVAG